MLGEEFLPPYTPGERSRELCHLSQTLRKRASKVRSQSRALQDQSARLLITRQYAFLTTVLILLLEVAS